MFPAFFDTWLLKYRLCKHPPFETVRRRMNLVQTLTPQFDLMWSCSFHLRIPCSIFRSFDHNFVCISRLFHSCYKPRPSSARGFVAVMLGGEYQISLLEFSLHISYLLSSPTNLCLHCRIVTCFPVTPVHPHVHKRGSRSCACFLIWK